MNLDQTALNALQDDSRVQTEIRRQNNGLVKFAKALDQGATWLSPEMRNKLSTIVNQTFEMPALKEKAIVVLNAESFNIPINQSESEFVTATKITMFSGYRYNPATFTNNLISKEQYRMNKYEEIFKAFAKAKEGYIQTFLETQKTQVLDVTGAPSGYNFNAATDALEIPLANQNDIMLTDLDTIMQQNDLNNPNYIVGNYGLQHVINQYSKYGANNDKNLQAQVLPIEAFLSNQITNSDRWTGYLGQSGEMGVVENYLPDFAAGTELANAKWGVTDLAVPFLGERIAMFQNKGLADASSLGTSTTEYTMTTFEEEAFISKFFLIRKYNSDLANRVNGIVRLEGATT